MVKFLVKPTSVTANTDFYNGHMNEHNKDAYTNCTFLECDGYLCRPHGIIY